MTDLIIVAFPDETTAFEARDALMRLQKEYLIELEDAVVITRSDAGNVKLHQPFSLSAAGAVGGTFWGALVGLLFMNPLIGAAAGAGAGAISGALTDVGIEDAFLKQVGTSVEPGHSALAVLVRKMTTDKVLLRMSSFSAKARILQTSLPDEAEARLRDAMGPG